MRVLEVEIENILSIEKAKMSFEDNGLVLVEGWNYDTNRANGAGKTALFNCIAYGLYDKLPRRITASEILRRGSKSGFVRCSVACGEDVWTVQRARPKSCEYFKNGLKVDIGQEEFESQLRLSYDQFLLTMYIAQANSGESSRFLAVPDASKKEFILQLLNLNLFKDCKEQIDGVGKALQASIDLETNKLATARSRIEAYEESLVDTASVEKQVNDLLFSITAIEKEILELSNVAKPDLSKYVKLEDSMRTKQSDVAQAKAKRSVLSDRYRELAAAIADYDPSKACGECGSSLDSADARTAHAEHQTKIRAKALEVKEQIDAADLTTSKETALNEMARKLREKKQQESADYQAAQLRINELKSFVRTQNLKIETLSSKQKANEELVNKINALTESSTLLVSSIAKNKKQQELMKALAAVYSPTGAQAYVLDSVVDSFNEVIQKYIDIMSPDISYTLNSFKENAKGDVVAKFSETLTKAGTEVSVGSLSGGEEKGLSLCVDFALLEVLETQFGMTLNPIILDEPFDGLDAAGREIVIDLLETLARNRQIFVVDHASEAKALFTKSIKVELKNSVSTISLNS